MSATEGAVAAAVAAGAFSYNRGNYMNDAGFRWERFTSAREYANQQSEQYRADLRNLAALTVKKNTVWCITSTLCMALCVALYCAGRLGLHGPSPPAWIMGLWLTNNAASFAFMAMCMFLAMHASFRAQAASTHLLTRTTRLPIPTLKQLDNARRFASEFEQQSWGDIFRIPYMSNNGAPRTDEAVFASDIVLDEDEGALSDGQVSYGRGRSAPPASSRRRCRPSSWIRDEFQTDRAGTCTGPMPPVDAAPEHFELFKAVQKEFYQYDIYARVAIFYGFISYVQSLCYYGLGHINIELRAFWVAYATVFVIATLMALLLRFDIVPANPNKKEYLTKCEYLGPLAVLPAAIGMSLDFKVEFDPTSVAFCWIMIFIAYFMQLIYSLRMLEVCLPDEDFAGLAERLGSTVLPQGWRKVPSAFQHVWYFVAPPSKLQPGQHDIVREIKYGGAGATEDVCPNAHLATASKDEDGDKRSPDAQAAQLFASTKDVEPWKFIAALNTVLPCTWVFLIFGNLIDVAIGEQGLVTAPHWSRPPMSRLSREPHELGSPLGFPWPAAAKPWLPEQMAWHEEKRHADEYNLRRLQAEDEGNSAASTVNGVGLSAALQAIIESLPGNSHNDLKLDATKRDVSWPSFFEPKFLACGNGQVTALTPRGLGATASMDEPGHVVAKAFSLQGLTQFPPMIGASWGSHGLLLVARDGQLVECVAKGGGAWSCNRPALLPQSLPGSKHQLLAASVGNVTGQLHAAVVHDHLPDLVALYVHDGGDDWLPVGEVRIPIESGKVSVSFSGDSLFWATGAGHVVRRRLSDGKVTYSSMHAVGQGGSEWMGACSLNQPPAVAHLHLRKSDNVARRPEVVVVNAEAPTFQ